MPDIPVDSTEQKAFFAMTQSVDHPHPVLRPLVGAVLVAATVVLAAGPAWAHLEPFVAALIWVTMLLTWRPTFTVADVAICRSVALVVVRAFWPQGQASVA